MRPIAHAGRGPSRDTSSRHAIDAVVAGDPVPIGIPGLFIADQLSRGRSVEQILGGKRGLLAEYAGAHGYACRWGHVLEIQLGRFVLWRVVPVAMWEQLTERRVGSQLLIEELLTLVQPGIHPALDAHLPRGLLLTGCQGATRRSPHALFALLLADPKAANAVRQWLATPLLTDVLPHLLDRVECRVNRILRKGAR